MGVGPWSTGISVLIRRDTKELAPFPTLRKKKERKKGGKEEKEGEQGQEWEKQEEKEPKKNQRKKITWGHSKKIDTCKPGIEPSPET